MISKNCLNCEKELIDQYCSGCGQKADTHRISFKHFIFHDVLHGTFHLEKGILFTAKQALTRPGKAALDYISGKRQRYYNVFYLILLTIGLILFLRHFYAELYDNLTGEIEEPVNLDEASKKINTMLAQKSKIIIFLFIPLVALNSFLLFRRKKLNLSEHAVVAGMVLLGMLLISAVGNLLFYFTLLDKSDILANLIDFGTPSIVVLYIIYGYANAFGSDYSNLGTAYRILLFFVMFCIESWMLLILLVGFATDWKFGPVTITPFG
jgi:hypothetical protein